MVKVILVYEKCGYFVLIYLEFKDGCDLIKGIVNFGFGLCFFIGYVVLQNWLVLLIEMYMFKFYVVWVCVIYDLVYQLLVQIDGVFVLLFVVNVVVEVCVIVCVGQFGVQVLVIFKFLLEFMLYQFKGYVYMFIYSDVFGSEWIYYDLYMLCIYCIFNWNDLLLDFLVMLLVVYVVLVQWIVVIDCFVVYGIVMWWIDCVVIVCVVGYQFDYLYWVDVLFEGYLMLCDVDVILVICEVILLFGLVIVLMDQCVVNVVIVLFELQVFDLLLCWGYFDVVFELKEYGELCVLEQFVCDMLVKDLVLKVDF